MQQHPRSTLDVMCENWRGHQEKLRDAMEHDLHHGGEVSLILGMNGLLWSCAPCHQNAVEATSAITWQKVLRRCIPM